MVCDSTFLLDQKSRFDTKIGEALQLVSSLLESGQEKVVVFSQWERMTRIMAEEFDRAGIAYEYLHGGVPSQKRGRLTESFASDPAKRVFLSTDAGSTGLNLQAASLVINLDLPWNPAVLEQRIARVYRIGQKRHVQVVNMVSAGTIEERMLATLNFKSDLFAGILDGGDDSITLDDSKLNRIVDAVTAIIPEEEAPEGTLVGENEEPRIALEPRADSDAPGFDPSFSPAQAEPDVTPDPQALLARGIGFIADMAATLKSPQATEKLVDAIVCTDPETGRSELRIPVESRRQVADFINTIAKLFAH